MRRPPPGLVLAAALLGAAAILVLEAISDSVTVDEFAHLPAGLFYLSTGRFNLYNLSPPLLRELAALPVLVAGPAGDFARFVGEPEHWALGYDFMDRNPVRYHALFVLGRLPMVALALALVLAVYACGARHLGTTAGLAAAVLAAFCPTVLAHGHLVGTDVGCALATFLATWALFEVMRRPSVRGTLAAGLVLGTALLTKFSALAFGPAFLVLALGAGRRAARWWHPGAVLVGASAVALLVVNLGYLAEGTGRPLAAYTFESPDLRALASGAFGRLPLPLPADFVAGFDRQRAEAHGLYPVFFHGTWATTGWWYYLPAAFALKETLPMLVLVLAGAGLVAVRRTVRDRLPVPFLVVPPLLFGLLFVLLTDIDLGVRYLLPAYPFLFLLAAVPFVPGACGPRGRRVAGALVALHVASSIAATPSHLAFFNALAGRRDGAYRWLVDSNLDWGQDLRRLRAYQDARRIDTVRLAYFGRVAPEIYGVRYTVPVGPIVPGTYAVSASLLAGRPYWLYDHGRVWDAPADVFAPFRQRTPTAVIGHAMFVYDVDDVR